MKIQTLIFVFIIFTGCNGPEVKRDRFLKKGNIFMGKKDYDAALKQFNEALKIDPEFSKALNNKGIILKETGFYRDAVIAFDIAIQNDPEMLSAYLNRAQSYMYLKEYSRSLSDLEILENALPDTSIVQFMKGLCQYYSHDYNSAEISFKNALNLDRKNPEIWINLAGVYYSMKDLDRATSNLNEAFRLDPEIPEAYNLTGLIEIEKRNYKAALEYLNNGIGKNRNNPYLLNNRGYVYLMTGQPDKAVEDINLSIQLDSENAWAYRNKGLYYYTTGRYDDALRILHKAIGMDDSLDLAHYFLGKTYLELKKKEQACIYFNISATRLEEEGIEAKHLYCD